MSEERACVIRDDDIERIEIAVKWADVIILASPTHWGNISAYMLRMFERLFG
jgi:multimeric flavodoxin WrbA